jgi:hypothetical protein
LISKYLPITSEYIDKLMKLFKENKTPDSIEDILSETQNMSIKFNNTNTEILRENIQPQLKNLYENYKQSVPEYSDTQEECFL